MGRSVEDANKKAARSADDLNKRMAALGAAFTAGAAVLGQWSRNSQDAQAIQRQLEAAIAATGDEYAIYADRIQEAGERAVQLGQDDEAASQAIAALTEVTGSASVALDQMGLVMDLAAAKGMSLEAAAVLVGKVLGGNTALLNRQGFAIAENATAQEALAEVQRAVAGQAEASATTYKRLREEMSNVTDAIGGAVGGFAPMLAMLPGLSVGFTAVGGVVGALAPNLTKAAVASKVFSASFLGPAGLVLAIGAAALAIRELIQREEELDLSGKEATATITDFTEAIAGIGPGLRAGELVKYVDLLKEVADQTQANKKTILDAQEAEIAAQSALDDAIRTGTEAQAEAAQQALFATQDLQAQLEANIVTQEEFNALQAALLSIFSDPNPLNQGIVADEVARLTKAWRDGDLTADAYIAAIIELDKVHKQYGLTLDELAGKQDRGMHRWIGTSDVVDDVATSMAAMGQEVGRTVKSIDTFDDAARRQETMMGGIIEETNRWSAAQTKAAEEGEQAFADWAGGLEQSFGTAITGVNAWSAETNAAFAAAEAQAIAFAQSLGVLDSFAEKLRPIDISVSGGDKATGTAANLEREAAAFESSTRVIIGQTNAIDGNINAVGDWALAMMTTEERVGKLDELLSRGIISQAQHTQGVKYANQILQDNVRTQDSLAKINARQIPFIEQQTEAYADQLSAIAAMPPEMARVTLGFMDVTEAQKAQNAVTLAASAAMGELGEQGEATATAIIEGAVAADPILEEMLTSIGLVARDREGNLKVNFPEGKSLNELVMKLDESIDNLTAAILGIPPSANTDITVSGAAQAEAEIYGVKNAIDALYDRTINVTTVRNVIPGDVSGIGFRHGGVVDYPVPHAQHGMAGDGRWTMVGEDGPELARLPLGSSVTPAPATRARFGDGGIDYNKITQAFLAALRAWGGGWSGGGYSGGSGSIVAFARSEAMS